MTARLIDRLQEGRFNRRQLLKLVGVGSGVMMLGGLTGCTSQLLGLGDSSQSQVVALSNRSAFARSRKAKEKLNQRFLQERFGTLKHLIKTVRKEIKNNSSSQERIRKLAKVNLR